MCIKRRHLQVYKSIFGHKLTAQRNINTHSHKHSQIKRRGPQTGNFLTKYTQRIYTYTHTRTHTYTNAHTHTHTHTHTHILTHTHTQIKMIGSQTGSTRKQTGQACSQKIQACQSQGQEASSQSRSPEEEGSQGQGLCEEAEAHTQGGKGRVASTQGREARESVGEACVEVPGQGADGHPTEIRFRAK